MKNKNIVDRNNVNDYKRNRKNLNKKEKMLLKLALSTCVVIAGLNALYFTIAWASVSLFETSIPFFKQGFYTDHFLLPISILMIGLIALILPFYNRYSSYKNDVKNDNVMIIIGILLIFVSLISLMSSFM